ncbi:MAG: hypothetical protein A2Y10_03555 [Planctomycetes bacterium GWF2_41_51]|nr:MAG: hypothetical protein A2Y10_03555 [Planctomycetes bacterium GWF2_41_51]HBG28943.1 hypothetical protein [Phycisphaerales bacterium]
MNFSETGLNKIRQLSFDEVYLPDSLLTEAYVQSARNNVMAAEKPQFYEGFFSVCVDGKYHGGNDGITFPGLDWGQIMEALLWLGQNKKVLASWNYVKQYVRSDGKVPFVISPLDAGRGQFEKNGALFEHWCPGNPLRMLANVTMLQVADAICHHNLDKDWLKNESSMLQRIVNWLEAELITKDYLVEGAGFYAERPIRFAYDGIAQCYTADTFSRIAELFKWIGFDQFSDHCKKIAGKIAEAFQKHFWIGDRFAEYIHPDRGQIAFHGYTDVDWAAIATGIATPKQMKILWPNLKNNQDFYYADIPTGISTNPQSYEPWEWEGTDRNDLAAMGRVWYLEAWARYRMKDSQGLIQSIHKVAEIGKKRNWYWRERFYSPLTGDVGIGYNIDTYLEYPANLIRIMNQFVLGIRRELDSSITVNPCATDDMWQKGFGRFFLHQGHQIPLFYYKGKLEFTNIDSSRIHLDV